MSTISVNKKYVRAIRNSSEWLKSSGTVIPAGLRKDVHKDASRLQTDSHTHTGNLIQPPHLSQWVMMAKAQSHHLVVMSGITGGRGDVTEREKQKNTMSFSESLWIIHKSQNIQWNGWEKWHDYLLPPPPPTRSGLNNDPRGKWGVGEGRMEGDEGGNKDTKTSHAYCDCLIVSCTV